ncbi:EAL domain-containing protein [Vibrio scophthalmi]|uniref:putative bifunctional diguanylate cyclase/phosphodiesterase n=1 Tax=Vibrio scophthalmi TaxID=45658 RepID=UPI002FF154DF
MRLVKRVDFTLLPFIILVFSLGGYFVYDLVKNRSYDLYQVIIKRDLESLDKEVSLEIRSYESLLSEVINSSEFIRFANEHDPHYQAFSLNAALFHLLERKLKDSAIESLHVLDYNGDIMVEYVHNADPFREPNLPTLPNNFVERTITELKAAGQFSEIAIVYQNDAGDYLFAFGQSFSNRLLPYDKITNLNRDYLMAFTVAKLDSFAHFQQLFSQVLDETIPFTLKATPKRKAPSTSIVDIIRHDGDISAELTSHYFRYAATIPEETILNSFSAQTTLIVSVVLSISFVCFLFLRWLIFIQVVRPINELAAKVIATHDLASTKLEKLDSEDEVAELNNAYLHLLEEVQHLASFDTLTGLANRRCFEHWLESHVKAPHQINDKTALLFIDLDNFKSVNDQFGHATGDALLREFGTQLKQVIRASDTSLPVHEANTARLAGDEFAVVLADIDSLDSAISVAKRILRIFDHGIIVDEVSHEVKASIGIALMPDHGSDANSLLRHADAAMYQAKANGRNRYEVFNQTIAQKITKRDLIEAELKQALATHQLELVYMPIYDLRHEAIIGYETLLRCPSLQSQGIGPDEFIPIAEASGLIKQIDMWVLENALHRYKDLTLQGFNGYVSVNISAVELKNDYFVLFVHQCLERYAIDASQLHLEITETRLVDPDDAAIETLRQLHDLGVYLVLDDFGTGYTAFNQLLLYPVQAIKIDRCFVSHMDEHGHKTLVDTFLAIGKIYQLDVVAEGVETAEQMAFLRAHGCHYGQGYYLSKPISEDAFIDMTIKQTTR